MLFLKMTDKVNKILEIIVGCLLGSMVVVVFTQVFVRFVLNKMNIGVSLPWTEELSRYLMIWLIFLGGAIIVRKADALAIEAVVQALPIKAAQIIKWFIFIVIIIFYAWIFYIGLKMARLGLNETAPVMRIPMFFVYSAMPVGAVLTILNAVTFLIDVYVNKKDILIDTDLEMEEMINKTEGGGTIN